MLKKLSAQKLEEIVEAAITEFAHKGREKASMKEIASASGVSVGVLYNYYENKDALYNAALEKCFENLKNVISINIHEAGSITGLFSRLVDTVYSYADEHSDYLQLYFSLTQGTEEEASLLAGKFEALSAAASAAGTISSSTVSTGAFSSAGCSAAGAAFLARGLRAAGFFTAVFFGSAETSSALVASCSAAAVAPLSTTASSVFLLFALAGMENRYLLTK